MDITSQEIFAYMASYNQAIYPIQYVAYLLGIIAVLMTFKSDIISSKIISGILAFLCLWVALAFGLPFALQGELLGRTTAITFLIIGVLFIWQIFLQEIKYGTYSTLFTIIGFFFIFYAMFGYPLIGHILERRYPQTLPFGLAPCPLTVFIFGIFMLTRKKFPKWLLFLPFLYSLSGFFPIKLGIFEDIGLVLSGLVCAPLILYRDRCKIKDNETKCYCQDFQYL